MRGRRLYPLNAAHLFSLQSFTCAGSSQLLHWFLSKGSCGACSASALFPLLYFLKL